MLKEPAKNVTSDGAGPAVKRGTTQHIIATSSSKASSTDASALTFVQGTAPSRVSSQPLVKQRPQSTAAVSSRNIPYESKDSNDGGSRRSGSQSLHVVDRPEKSHGARGIEEEKPRRKRQGRYGIVQDRQRSA